MKFILLVRFCENSCFGTVINHSQIASNMSEALNSLLDAYQQIGEQIPQLSQYQDLFSSSPHMGDGIVHDFPGYPGVSHREALGILQKAKYQAPSLYLVCPLRKHAEWEDFFNHRGEASTPR